jgi:hypothetical protein
LKFVDAIKIINVIKHKKLEGSSKISMIDDLLKHDQLRLAFENNKSLANLREGKIEFMPTYKMEEQSDFYKPDGDKTPSW